MVAVRAIIAGMKYFSSPFTFDKPLVSDGKNNKKYRNLKYQILLIGFGVIMLFTIFADCNDEIFKISDTFYRSCGFV